MALRECPLCGDKDEYNPSVSPSYGYLEPGDPAKGTTGNPAAGLKEAGRYVECDKCGCCGPTCTLEADAVSLWNTRPEAVTDELTDLEKEMARILYNVRVLLRGGLMTAEKTPFIEQIDAALSKVSPLIVGPK